MKKYLSLLKAFLIAAAALMALASIGYTLDHLSGWLDDYGQYRTDIVMNRVVENFCADGQEDSEIKGCLPTPTTMACVEIHKEKSGWTTITVYPKKGDDRPVVRFYNIYSPMSCWDYEIIWHGEDDDKTDKYVRQARRDALANINMVTRDFPGNLMPF